MPDLPLHDPMPGHPDAWHKVRSPGGYEWWYFDAEDSAGRYRVVAIFLDGFVFHPAYLRRYHQFKNDPIRHRPPVASEYPCAYFAIYDGDKLLAQFMHQYRTEEFFASSERPEVTIGPNTFQREADGSLRLHLSGVPWELTWQGPKLLEGETLAADLVFRPQTSAPPRVSPFLSKEMTGDEHQWVIANPRCGVEGTIRTGAADDGVAIDVAFSGQGYHDHNYGLAPIGPGLRRWVWGRAIADDRMYTFHFARAQNPSLPDEVHLVRVDADSLKEVETPPPVIDWSRRTSLGLSYPQTIDFGPAVRLTSPRVVDAAPFYMRLIYDAALDDGARLTTAFCEVAYPHRLTWPVVGRMIEMSITRGGVENGKAGDLHRDTGSQPV